MAAPGGAPTRGRFPRSGGELGVTSFLVHAPEGRRAAEEGVHEGPAGNGEAGGDEDEAGDDLEDLAADAEQLEGVADGAQQHDAAQHAQDRTDPAEDGHPAEQDRGHDLEFEAEGAANPTEGVSVGRCAALSESTDL